MVLGSCCFIARPPITQEVSVIYSVPKPEADAMVDA